MGSLCNDAHRVGLLPSFDNGLPPEPAFDPYHNAHINDTPLTNNINMIGEKIKGYKVVFCTSRPDNNKSTTIKWMKENVSWYSEAMELLMRPAGMAGHPVKMKKWMLDKAVGLNNVEMIIDDDPKIVKAFEEIGVEGILIERNDNVQVSS